MVEIVRTAGRWRAYRLGEGIRLPAHDIVLPDDLEAAEVVTYLEDLFHELARPGSAIETLG